jgi:tRNA nucleotidyltransferase/poly(A) polymerase
MTKLLLDWTRHPAPLEVVRALRRSGHAAYLAGGCVRDLRLGLAPKDFDVATSASPDDVRSVFRRTVPVQTELGVTMVLWAEERIEVTTFRSEAAYLDGRRPSRVGPADARLDVQRRDFTINGLLLDPESGEIIDHVGGLDDLDARILRCIREPADRFEEDHLRILRAVRFAVRFGLEIEERTWVAMTNLSSKTARLSGERIQEELAKMESQGNLSKSVALLLDSGVLRALCPPLDMAVADTGSRRRLLDLLDAPIDTLPGSWVTALGLPLCPWWNAPSASGHAEPATSAQREWLERLRCSRNQTDGSLFAWSRWPTCWEQPVPAPSRQASLVRDRSWPLLAHLLARFQASRPDQWSPLPHLRRLAESIPRNLPSLGEAFLAAGIPKGPALGAAIREADRLNLDQGLALDAALVARVAETILGPS